MSEDTGAGQGRPEVPRVPRPEPEMPDPGAAPGREIPGIPRAEPELPARRPARPEAPSDPNAPGQ